MAIRTKTFGGFGKGTEGSLALNFGISGGRNCATSCPHHPESAAANPTYACYAAIIANRPDRAQLAAKLSRHEDMTPAQVCGLAIVELRRILAKGHRVPWLRISAFGSLPNPRRASPLFISQLRALLKLAKAHNIPIHLPIETKRKAAWYRAKIGDLVTVRQSAVSESAFLSGDDNPASCTAGETGTKLRERAAAARDLARKRRELTGRKCIVCPAVLNTFAAKSDPRKKNENAKCGNCTACADSLVDIVYPIH